MNFALEPSYYSECAWHAQYKARVTRVNAMENVQTDTQNATLKQHPQPSRVRSFGSSTSTLVNSPETHATHSDSPASSFLAELNKGSEVYKKAVRTKTIPWGLTTVPIVQPKPIYPDAFAALLNAANFEEEDMQPCEPVRDRRINKYGFYEDITVVEDHLDWNEQRSFVSESESSKQEELYAYIGAWFGGYNDESNVVEDKVERYTPKHVEGGQDYWEHAYAEYISAKAKKDALALKDRFAGTRVEVDNSAAHAGWGRPWAAGIDVNVYIDCPPWGRPWAVE